MTQPVTLLMAIHCHQPVGNFGFVFEEAFAKAYDPFLSALERHPNVRLALHYSGSLLDWLAANQPAFLGRVKALARRGQVELLASGYFEPILPMIPEADRQGQIGRMRQALRNRFGEESQGLWLTERIWEPELAGTLSDAGIRYTMLDTNQFRTVKPWIPAGRQIEDGQFWDLLGSFATEHTGSSVRLFPASKRLRYWLPFQPVEQTIEWLRRLQRDEPAAVTFADDGEKFGLWPTTYKWVYEEGWLNQFFAALEREGGWLRTSTFRDYAASHAPDGCVYLPAGSYEEMLEWSGGHFMNFFTKYAEANAMRQKMLRVSNALSPGHQVTPGPPTAIAGAGRSPRGNTKLIQRAKEALYAGQCNCAYWHGVFGGLYLSHLRRAVYERLITAEALADRAARRPSGVRAIDADGDGRLEALATTSSMQVVVDPDDGGTINEWSVISRGVNLLDTLTRRPEPYHAKLKATQAPAPSYVEPGQAPAAPASIHDLTGAKEENLASHVVYDDHRRAAFHDYAFQQRPTLQEAVRSTWGERRLWTGGPYKWEKSGKGANDRLAIRLTRRLEDGVVRKTIRLAAARPVVECAYELEGVSAPVIALEFNLSVRDPRYAAQPGQLERVSSFQAQEKGGASLKLAISSPATVYHFPVETVSESEEGLERTYQGLCVVCLWELPTSSQGRPRSWSANLTWTAS